MLYFPENAPNIAAKPIVEPLLKVYYAETRKLLPELPDSLTIWLSNQNLIGETGTGGFAFSPSVMNIAFDINFQGDTEQQKHDLRGSVMHEAYHLVQGHTLHKPSAIYERALDAAVYEGCATVFEREYAGAEAPWGLYSQHDEVQLEAWRDVMAATSAHDYWHAPGVWESLAFYDPADEQYWKLYKVGAWLVDKTMREKNIDVIDMRRMSAQEILSKTNA